VSYELSLAPDLDRGGHSYRAELAGELEADTVRELSEWLDDAKQNPDARFVLDLSAATGGGRRARGELRALLRRHDDLRAGGRLTLLEPPRARRRTLSGAAGAVAALPFLERAITSGPLSL
jgi:hypothetical protein